MSSFVSLIPEGMTVPQMLAGVSFQHSLLKEVPDIEGSAVHKANHLLGMLRDGLRDSAVFDPEVLPSLCSLVGIFYCLGEGDWEDISLYSPVYITQVLSNSYPVLECDGAFKQFVLNLKRYTQTEVGKKKYLEVSLGVLLEDLTSEIQIGDRVRGLVFFILGFLVAANISCESRGMLAFMSLFKKY